MTLTHEQSNLLQRWQNAVEIAAEYKHKEAELRQQIAAELFPNARDGTNTLEIGNGYKLKFVGKTNYKVSGDINETVMATGAIKLKPELSLTVYKTLSDANKAIVDEVLTTSPGLPALSLEVPK